MTHPVVPDVRQLYIAFRRQLQFYLRTWRFIGLLLFTVIISGIVFAVDLYLGRASVTAGTSAAGFLSSYLSNISLAVILTAAFLGGDAISMDFGSPTGYYVLVQPVRRWVLLLGRFLAAAFATLVIAIVYVAIALLATSYFYSVGQIPGSGLALGFGILLLFVLAATSAAFAFSALFRSPVVGIIVTVFVLWLGLTIVTGISEFAGVEPWFSLTYAGDGVWLAVLPGYAHQTTMHAAMRDFSTFHPYLWEAAVILVGYLVVFYTIAFVSHHFKESKG